MKNMKPLNPSLYDVLNGSSAIIQDFTNSAHTKINEIESLLFSLKISNE